MHSFSYPFLSNTAISDFKIIPFSISWKPSLPSKFHIFLPSHNFSNSKIYRNFLPWRIFSIRFTHKKRIYKRATNHPFQLSNYHPKSLKSKRRRKYKMRLTNEEILIQFPSWANHPSGNIQQVRYGDIPDCQYTQGSYNRYQSETDRHTLNIGCTNAYI